jgi:hypothetical protein
MRARGTQSRHCRGHIERIAFVSALTVRQQRLEVRDHLADVRDGVEDLYAA